MNFASTLPLDEHVLRETFASAVEGWPVDPLIVRVRYSRGADFSGTCIYDTHRIYVNLGRHLKYPYHMHTYCARSRKAFGKYYKPSSIIELCDGYQVCLFIFLHEVYHWLIKQAGRNTAQKESMCDRFAARHLIDVYGCAFRDSKGRALPRDEWDIQDLDGFVAAARTTGGVEPVAVKKAAREVKPPMDQTQFLLFG